jgi:hypothetical protein
MWWDIAPEMQAEFEDWHTHEHMPERLAIPGFLRGTRFIAPERPSYFVLYEARSLAVLNAGAYLERLNNPTPWSRKLMPHHLNMVRSVCGVHASFGGGMARAVSTVRFTPPRGKAREIAARLRQILPATPQRKGLAAAHLLHSRAMSAGPRTAEQEIRGKDAQADWALLVCGYDPGAVVDFVDRELQDLPGAAVGHYAASYSLASKELA